MQFFMPRTSNAQSEIAYADIKRILLDQLGMPITERRIYSLSYASGKRVWRSQVGQIGQRERQYEVMAIFELAKVYIVYNKTPSGEAGPITLIDKEEVTSIEEFIL